MKNRNFCINLVKKEKKKYYNNLDLEFLSVKMSVQGIFPQNVIHIAKWENITNYYETTLNFTGGGQIYCDASTHRYLLNRRPGSQFLGNVEPSEH